MYQRRSADGQQLIGEFHVVKIVASQDDAVSVALVLKHFVIVSELVETYRGDFVECSDFVHLFHLFI